MDVKKKGQIYYTYTSKQGWQCLSFLIEKDHFYPLYTLLFNTSAQLENQFFCCNDITNIIIYQASYKTYSKEDPIISHKKLYSMSSYTSVPSVTGRSVCFLSHDHLLFTQEQNTTCQIAESDATYSFNSHLLHGWWNAFSLPPGVLCARGAQERHPQPRQGKPWPGKLTLLGGVPQPSAKYIFTITGISSKSCGKPTSKMPSLQIQGSDTHVCNWSLQTSKFKAFLSLQTGSKQGSLHPNNSVCRNFSNK